MGLTVSEVIEASTIGEREVLVGRFRGEVRVCCFNWAFKDGVGSVSRPAGRSLRTVGTEACCTVVS